MNEPTKEPEISYTEKQRKDFAAFLRQYPLPLELHPGQLAAVQAWEDADSIEAEYKVTTTTTRIP